MTAFRLAAGGLIDRSLPLGFRFDGTTLQGFAGDTLASALLANDRLLVGRSFKYHRPRGVVTAGAAEPNALVTLGRGGRTEPNCRATVTELYAGLEAASQNRWPSLGVDLGAAAGLLSPMLGAGFYYKTFMWPAVFWEKLYEPLIRRAAGLGRATYEADPDHYEKCWAHCDLLIVGAGAAGLAAALTAARAGARVIVADEQATPGGALLSETREIDGLAGPAFAARLIDELRSHPKVTVMPRTTVFGWYDDNVFGALERVQKHLLTPDPDRPVERLWRIAARHCIMASGAEERPLVFGDNDRPGIMTAGAMRTYANRYGVAAGKRIALFTNNDSAYATASDLETAGVEVAAIIDARPDAPAYGGRARVLSASTVIGTGGWQRLSGVRVRSGGREERLAVDALGVSGGWSPVVHLACQRGQKPVWSETHTAFLPPEAGPGLSAAGAATGEQTIGGALASGAGQAATAMGALGFSATPATFGTAAGDGGDRTQALWYVPGFKGKAFVDFQNDVHAADLGLAAIEGYGHVEHAKRYTTTGMATDQGKLGNVNAAGILAELQGRTPAEVGTTTFRPFYTPVSFGALAGAHRGEHFQPRRRSPLHDWAEARGAQFVDVGHWQRAAWFPQPGETFWRDSVDREVAQVRSGVGLTDVSTLGKIEIVGSDAATFLHRIYCNNFLKLPVGKARYGIMLREDGFIYDDGTTSRLDEHRYVMTTTTALAAGVLTHLEFCAQTLWPELDVRFASTTDQWAQIAVAGPKSRAVLQRLIDEDISDGAVPFMGARTVNLCGGQVQGRLFRVSFSGELAYEIAVPAGYGGAIAERIMAAGTDDGIVPYGTEAMAVMRIEKGHVTHAEMNGTVVPDDLGFGGMVSKTKDDFIGRAMLGREDLIRSDRPQLVGLTPLDPVRPLRAGAHILGIDDNPVTADDQGYVTSACYSPTLGHAIALALVKGGRARHGEEILVWDDLRGEHGRATICDPVFVDPKGEKLHV